MATPAVILCDRARLTSRAKTWVGAKTVRVRFDEPNNTGTLRIEDIAERLVANLPPVIADLVEVAAYVYCADQGVTRGGSAEFDYGTRWRRHFRFEVPVRCPDQWCDPKVKEELEAVLGFLSDDVYDFAFTHLAQQRSLAPYLAMGQESASAPTMDSVMLFSGGLDSFTGAVAETVTAGHRAALVSHRSVAKIDSRQRALVDQLRSRAGARRKPLHVPVWVHLHNTSAREFTQRSRSFLFAALGVAVAAMFGVDRVSFYENGITSLNLPICEQVVGGRATRTTHPKVMRGLTRLMGNLLGNRVRIESPFAWQTKTDVAVALRTAGHADLARNTVSCTRTIAGTKLHTHCGLCSQCIDRRFATLGGDYGADDPAEMYAVDLLTGARDRAMDRTMAERWVGMARTIEQVETPSDFFVKFPEANDAVSYLDGPADGMANRIFELHKRHACQIGGVLNRAIAKHASDLRLERLPATCLLRLAGLPPPPVPQKPVRDAIPQIITNAALAEKATLSDADEMSRVIRKALGKAGHAVVGGGPGKQRSWTRLQLQRALPHLPEGRLRALLERSGLAQPEET